MPKTSAAISRALVQKVRTASVYTSAVGDNRTLNGVFKGFAPEAVNYPYVLYNKVAAPYEDDWTGRMILAAYDVMIVSENSVEADNLDELLAGELDEAQLTVSGMTSLICRRVADVPDLPDEDEEGRKIYQVGGTYEIWTDQPL